MKHLLILGTLALAAPVAAQTPAAKPTAKAVSKPAPKAAPTPVARTAKSLDCSKQADAKGLHGKPRKGFMSTCKKA